MSKKATTKKAKSKPAKPVARPTVIQGGKRPRNVRELTGLWKDLEQLAEDAGMGMDALYSMRSRNRIDAIYWRPVIRSAHKRRVPGITWDLLADIHEAAAKSKGSKIRARAAA